MDNTIFETDEDKIEKITNFDNMDLQEQLLRGVYAYGFEHPSTIQQMAIKPIRDGRDLIAQAQSGTGKTAAFLVSSMSIIDRRLHEPQILILAPTRELAIQIMTKHGYSTKEYLCTFTDIENKKVSWVTDKGEEKQMIVVDYRQ